MLLQDPKVLRPRVRFVNTDEDNVPQMAVDNPPPVSSPVLRPPIWANKMQDDNVQNNNSNNIVRSYIPPTNAGNTLGSAPVLSLSFEDWKNNQSGNNPLATIDADNTAPLVLPRTLPTNSNQGINPPVSETDNEPLPPLRPRNPVQMQADTPLDFSKEPNYGGNQGGVQDGGLVNALRPYSPPNQPVNQPLDASEQLLEARNRLYNLQNAPIVDQNGRVKSALIGAVEGLGQEFQTPVRGWGDFAGRLGGGIGGGIGGAINPKFDEQQKRQLDIAKAQNQVQGLETGLDNEAKRNLENGQAYLATQKPEMALRESQRKQDSAERSNMVRQYNAFPSYNESNPDDKEFGDAWEQKFGYRPPEKNAKTQSKQITDNRTGYVYLSQTDSQGNSKLTQLLNNDGTPFKTETNAMLGSADKAQQRDLEKQIADNKNITAVKVADIGAESRVQVANINQTGANQRADKALDEKRSEFIQNYQQKITQDKTNNTFKREAELTKLETAHHLNQVDDKTYQAMKDILDQQ